jgi:hypothetical protein
VASQTTTGAGFQLGEDLIKNVFLAGLLTVGVLWLERVEDAHERRIEAAIARQREQRDVARLHEVVRLAASGWSPLAEARDETLPANVVADLQEKVGDLRESADELEAMLQRGDDDAEVLTDLFQLAGALNMYIFEGARARRFAYFEFLQRELASLEAGGESQIATAVRRFRGTLPAALAWRSHTNTTVVERLIVEKVFVGVTYRRVTTESRDILDVIRLDQAAVVHEPLYLLQGYAVVNMNQSDSEEARSRATPVIRCIGALRNEMRAVATTLERLAELIETAASDRPNAS